MPCNSFFVVQNGSLHQKDTVHDNDFEPYLSGQSNQVGLFFHFFFSSSYVCFWHPVPQDCVAEANSLKTWKKKGLVYCVT